MKTKFLLLSIGLSSMSSLNAQTLYVPGGSVGTSSVSGKIGIGLSNPESRVEIKHTGTIGGLFDPTKAFLKITDNSTTLLMDGNEIYSNHILAIGSSYSHDIRFRNVSATGYQELMSIKPTGRVGIGTLSPSQKLHVSSGTSGDAILVLEADTDNNMESDNVEVNFSQDAGLVTGFIGFEGNPGAKSTGTYANAFILGSEDLSDRPIQFIHRDQVQMTVLNKVGIGTTTPTEKLEVNGTIRSKEVKVEASPWPDYVFEPDYELHSLEEIEQFIQSEGHLPEVPSAKEVEENGIALGEMNALLLKKIEELTLYQIELLKLIKKQNERIEKLEKN